MNKYQSTSRILVVAFQALLFLGFGAFGCYYGFFAVPFYLTPFNGLEGIVSTDYAYNLFLELAVIGLTIMTVAIYGLVQGIKGILEPKNDEPVVKGFTAFIVEGYLAAAFFFLNAFLYFDLIKGQKGENLTFVIVMASILFVVLMIATNIPMVRLYDNRDQKPLLASLSYGFAVAGAWTAIMNALTLIGSFSRDAENGYQQMRIFLLIGLAAGLMIALLLFFVGQLLRKGKKDNSSKTAGYLSSGAIAMGGAMYLVIGVLDVVWADARCHLNNASLKLEGNYTYGIMAIILGGLLLIGSLVFVYLNSQGTKKAAHKA